MCGLGVREESFERVASPGNVADLGEGLDQRGMNADPPGAFVQKLKIKLAPHGRHGSRIARNTSLRSGTVLVYFLIVSQQANSIKRVSSPAGSWPFWSIHPSNGRCCREAGGC